MNINIVLVNYLDKDQAFDMACLLNCYASDPMGGGADLDAGVLHNLAHELSRLPYAFSVLCYVDNKPAGLVNCFEAFSTFECKPLVNIHDVIVDSAYRGLNISQKMLHKVEEIAREKGCCKLTLEVLEKNKIAQNAYAKFGFAAYELDPEVGKALLWQKKLYA